MSKNTITTPKGTAVFPALLRPDTKFDELGQYKADLRVPLEEAKPLMEKLSATFKDHTGKAPSKNDNPMWKVEEDDEGNETGNVIFKLRVKNKMRKDGQLWDRRPRMFDAANNIITGVNPWGGSVLRVSAEVYAWTAGAKKGVSLQPLAVQVIDLVTGDGSSGASFGFGEEEGFTSDSNVEETFDDDEVVDGSVANEEDY